MQVTVQNENTVVVDVQQQETIVVEVDQGRAGRGIQNITYTEVSGQYFLIVTYTDGTTETLGPLVVTGGAAFLLGGATGSIPYQSAPNTTVFLPIGTQNQVVVAGATVPQYTSALTGLTVNNSAIGNTAPSTGAFTNLSASGTFALTGDQVQISEGGTGQTTANGAFNALAPSQTGNAGKYLKTDGTNSSWDQLDISTADITGTLPIANGGTGQTTANSALNALLPTQAAQSGKYLKTDGTNASWDQLDISTADITGVLPIANGGTGASTAAGARANLSAAILGTNNDITSLTGITGGISTPDFVQFDTTATNTNAVGKVYWDASQGTLDLGLLGGNVITRIGQTLVAYVTNAEAVTITKGQVVYLFGAQGDRATVKLASNLSDATSAKTFGVVAENITANGTGFVMCQGVLDGLNLGAFTAGDTLYLGATPGSLTATKPAAPNHLVYVGLVERANPGNGQLYVKVQNGYELDEIHDVQIINPQNGQTILYDASTSLWKNANLTAGTGISVTNGAASVTIGNTGVLSFSGGTTGLTPATSTTGVVTLGGTLAIGSGGTGQTTANASFNALAPSQTGNAGKYLKSDGTNTSWDQVDISTSDITGTLPIANGGTGQTTANAALNALLPAQTAQSGKYLKTDGVNSSWDQLDISTGDITGTLPVANGGTGATTAAGALTNLNAASQSTTISAGTGLSGGGDLSTNRTISIANTTVTAGAYGSASDTLTATVNAQGQLTALAATPIAIANTQISGLGTMSTQNASSVSITGGTITGITDLAVADGGTGASDASTARSNLGAAASATTISAGTGLSGGGDLSANRTLSIANTTVTAASYGSASSVGTFTVNAQGQLTAAASTPIAIANTQVSGLGTMSTQNSNSVTITGGSITGITDLAIADGGTGASDAPTARTNLGLGTSATLNAGVALGVATLDAGGTVPLSQLPASIQGGVSYQGSWDAATNTPTIVSSVGTKGYYYVVSVAGSTNINGISDWLPGDWIIFNGSIWQKIDNTDAVASVNGYTGVVVLNAADVGAAPTSRTITAGTGLTGGGDLSANRTISIANTTVAAGSYGSASSVGTFTVNGQGQLTAAASTPIAITNTQVSGLGTMSTQNANSVAITGGTIDGTTIGGTTRAAGSFTTLTLTNALSVANGGTGTTTSTGTGSVVLSSSPTLTTPNLGTPSAATLTNATGLPLTTGVTGTLPIGNGGTGQTTANAAFNALAPSQTGNAGKYLTTDGTNTSWATNPLGTVTSVDVSGGTTGLTTSGGPITSSGTITLGGTLGVANGGTGTTTAFTAGSVVFAGASGVYSQNNSQLFWDNTNTRLGIGTNSPATKLDVSGVIKSTGDAANFLLLEKSSNTGVYARWKRPNREYYLALDINNNGGNDFSLYDATAAATRWTVDSSGNLGLGATSTTGFWPSNLTTNAARQIISYSDATTNLDNANAGLVIFNSNSTAGSSSKLMFGANNSDPTAVGLAYISAVNSSRTTGYLSSSLVFGTAVGGGGIGTGPTERMRIDPSGRLLIGYTTSQASGSNLQVNTDAYIYGITVGRGAGAVSTNTAVGNTALRVNTTGDQNTGVGYASLYQNLGGSKNTSVGVSAMENNTTGNYNTALGVQALQANTTASNNTAVGYQAGYSNTTGAGNVAVGNLALYSDTTGGSHTAVGSAALRYSTGDYNTALGENAGRGTNGSFTGSGNLTVGPNTGVVLTTGNNNTFVGGVNSNNYLNAGAATTTGAFNAFIGGGAGASNTTGSNNVSLGWQALFSNTTANNNTALGYQAAYSNTTGTAIVAIGRAALYASTTGIRNIAIGNSAATNNTTGQALVAIGADSLFYNTTGVQNTAVGDGALQNNTTASNNTAIGYQAGFGNTTGNLTALGYRALYSATTGSENVAVGSNALGALTTGIKNTAIGFLAAYQLTTGNQNTATGRQALQGITTGSSNDGHGHNALYSTTTGNYNVAMGDSALFSNTTASYNTAVGYQAAYSNTTGLGVVAMGYLAGYAGSTVDNNTAIGNQALRNSTAGNNTAVGALSLYANTSGTYNVAVGREALQANTTASNNTALGFQALYLNTTASNNTAVGFQAGYNNTTGYFNTHIGVQAGFSITTGYENTAVGFGAGYSQTTAIGNTLLGRSAGEILTTGSYNTFVGGKNGANAGFSGGLMTTGNRNTILGNFTGNQSGLDIRTANNYIVLSDGDGNPRGVFDASGNFLVGTTTSPSGSSKVVFRQSGTSNPDSAWNTSAWTFSAVGAEPSLYLSSNIIAATGNAGATQTAKGGIGFRYVSAANPTELDIGIIGTSTVAGPVCFYNDTERARITSGGYFKASPTGTYGNSGSFHELRTNASARTVYVSNTDATTPFGILVGYTGSAPNGSGSPFLECEDTGGQRAAIRSNGGLANYQANDVNLSDQRLKTDVQEAGSYLDKICAIPVKTFLYKDQTDTERNLGVMAQDVDAVAPELIDHSGFGEAPEGESPYLAVYQTDLQYALMKCIQELKAQNDELRQRVAALEAK